jgi:hypothetical protein
LMQAFQGGFLLWRGFIYSKAQENLRASPPREGGGGGSFILRSKHKKLALALAALLALSRHTPHATARSASTNPKEKHSQGRALQGRANTPPSPRQADHFLPFFDIMR